MIAVIFEVEPRDGRRESYLDIAAEPRPLLEEVVKSMLSRIKRNS